MSILKRALEDLQIPMFVLGPIAMIALLYILPAVILNRLVMGEWGPSKTVWSKLENRWVEALDFKLAFGISTVVYFSVWSVLKFPSRPD